MTTFLTVLTILVCLILGGIILIQNSKGGGLDSSFSSSNQIMGVKRTGDFLEKATWTLAITLVVLCIASTMYSGNRSDVQNTTTEQSDELIELIDESAITPPATQNQAQPVQPAE